MLVTLATSYTQNLVLTGYVRALGSFSRCVGVLFSLLSKGYIRWKEVKVPDLCLLLLVSHIII